LRGEATNFLHDVTLRLHEAGIAQVNRPDPSDRTALLSLFYEQLKALGDDFLKTGIKTVILIDGLDHIEREQNVVRSLLQDLPLPEHVPDGVYIVLGSQTDELSGLPPRIHYTLQDNERRIIVGKLQLSDVQTIALEAIPELSIKEQYRVFVLSAGHPLALIYLLKRLLQAAHVQERSRILDESVLYTGNIEEQYWSHWRQIELDETLTHTLALLSRVRGSIALNWIAQWVSKPILRKLQKLFLTYFQQEGPDYWVFFHNSFRLFLIQRTEQPLPGVRPDHLRRQYHVELAEKYKESGNPWHWETLYHLYNSGNFKDVIVLGESHWFLDQVAALRPLDAVQTDIRLAIQAAGNIGDVVALARLTLIWAAVEQRASVLENRKLPDLLIKAGEPYKAAEQLRDNLQLRVEPTQALRLSVELIDAGLETEGRQLFALAEPLELLSGQLIADNHRRPQNMQDILREWAESATVIRGPKEVITVVRRIRVELQRFEKGDPEVENRRFQNWLLIYAALLCCQRGKWSEWQLFVDALNEEQDRRDYFILLLRSVEQAYESEYMDKAKGLLRQIFAKFSPDDLFLFSDKYQRVKILLDIAEAAIRVLDDRETAQLWIRDLPVIPLQETNNHISERPKLSNLRFRSARMCYFLGDSTDPDQLLKQAAEQTTFGQYIDKDEREGEWLLARAIYYLARLSSLGRLGTRLSSVSFLQEVQWIIDLFGLRYRTWTAKFRNRSQGR
jgi:hypothetical protein